MEEVGGVKLGEFVKARLTPEDGLEGRSSHLGVGFACRGVLADVGWNAVELLECRAPTPCPGTTGVDKRLVDIEEHDHWSCHLFDVSPSSLELVARQAAMAGGHVVADRLLEDPTSDVDRPSGAEDSKSAAGVSANSPRRRPP